MLRVEDFKDLKDFWSLTYWQGIFHVHKYRYIHLHSYLFAYIFRLAQ